MGIIFQRIKEMHDKEAAKLFQDEILSMYAIFFIFTTQTQEADFLVVGLYRFPPVFHEWFIETFPEPSAWLASRLSYSRTAAVMSMVGFILGYVLH